MYGLTIDRARIACIIMTTRARALAAAENTERKGDTDTNKEEQKRNITASVLHKERTT